MKEFIRIGVDLDVAAGAACGIGVSKQSGAFRFKSIGGRP